MQSMIPAIYERRVLILGGDDANRAILTTLSRFATIDYVECATAERILDDWQPGLFSFAFVDIQLPGRCGLEVISALRGRDDGLVLVLCSVDDSPATVAAAIQAGCDMFLAKPFDMGALLRLLQSLDRASARQSQKVLVVNNPGWTFWKARPER